jgi:hypothetical protein
MKRPDASFSYDWARNDPDGSEPSSEQPYDWYSAYGNSLIAEQTYVNRLKEDYTFGFPRNHGIVSQSTNHSDFFR